MEIKCKPSCDGCNQLYLLKGDACYRLAKAGDAPEKHYRCAAAELAEGIAMTRSWQMEAFDLNRPQTSDKTSAAPGRSATVRSFQHQALCRHR